MKASGEGVGYLLCCIRASTSALNQLKMSASAWAGVAAGDRYRNAKNPKMDIISPRRDPKLLPEAFHGMIGSIATSLIDATDLVDFCTHATACPVVQTVIEALSVVSVVRLHRGGWVSSRTP